MLEALSRVLGALAGGVAAWVTAKTGVDWTPEIIWTIGLTVYGVVHKLIDKKVNPADTAAKPAKAADSLETAVNKRDASTPLGTPLRR